MKLFRKIFIILVFSLPLLIISPGDASAQAFGEKILLIDFNRVTNESFVGQDVQAQLKTYGEQLTAQRVALEETLTAERDKLTEQRNLISSSDFEQLATEWETKARKAQIEIERMSQRLLRAGQTAEQEIARNLRPIVLRIMQEKGADMVFDKAHIYISRSGFDVTGEVIEALNATITSFPLRLQE
jgi:Skp family chaperone for outer membrane proteins